jgi:hypothetical protein
VIILGKEPGIFREFPLLESQKVGGGTPPEKSEVIGKLVIGNYPLPRNPPTDVRGMSLSLLGCSLQKKLLS